MVVYLYGRYGCGKSTLVRKVCADLGMPLLLADAAKIVHAQKTIAETIWLLGREAVLQQAVLCLDNFHRLIEEEGGTRFDAEQLFESFRTFMPLAFILGSGPWTPRPLPEGHIFIDLEIKPPEYWTRREIWKRYNDEYGLRLSESDMFELAAKFRLTQGQIREAIRAAGHHSLLTLPEEGRVTKEGIYRCCRAQSTPILIILARKMESPYSWDDIVLPAVSRAMLREICNHVKYHNVVYDDWGFRGKISLGRGLTVLFSGPSGTGKTMAAEVIANELGLELFRIDLSQIVSKYIGETEKNLNRIFEEAGDSNSILFFDEADALFGKRSEVRDSHDRYANIEIAYLLQKMEEYEGMTILATNLRKNIDEAFLRRMRFSIDFPVPDEKLSELIWRKIFPGSAPLSSDIDFPFLASRFKLTGGNIRNIALAASFYAAGEPSDIRMEHIIIAVQRELQKMGKLCVKGEFGKYYELVEKELRYE